MMIVCCGEALIDMLPRLATEGEECYLPKNGGSVFNTAIALGRLGVPTGFFSGLSTDFFGDSLKQGLSQSHVDLRYTKFKALPSMLAFVKLDKGHARYSFYDENSATRMLQRADLPKLKTDVAALHFGSIGLVHRPAADTYGTLLRREAKRRVISLDPNIRPSVISHKKTYLKRLKPLLGLADILKVSDEDVEWMTGKKDAEAAARRWLKAGAKIILITKGAQGVQAFTKHVNITRPAIQVETVDTVGAGDTFTAGFLAHLRYLGLLNKPQLATLPEDKLTAALDFAARAAAITCSRAGANPPWADEVR